MRRFTARAAVLATAGTTPAAVALPTFGMSYADVRITNPGTSVVYVNFGLAGVTATETSPYAVGAGMDLIVGVAGVTHAAAFAATGTQNVHLAIGTAE